MKSKPTPKNASNGSVHIDKASQFAKPVTIKPAAAPKPVAHKPAAPHK